jgi:hypothetical protein
MGEPIAVLALRRKRDQISGTIAHYERLLREAEHDLAHINASLRLFEATGEAADLPPYVDLNRVLRRGETTKICMDALAKEGPLDTRQLALRVIRAKGLSESDKVLAQTVALRVVQTLRMRARNQGGLHLAYSRGTMGTARIGETVMTVQQRLESFRDAHLAEAERLADPTFQYNAKSAMIAEHVKSAGVYVAALKDHVTPL